MSVLFTFLAIYFIVDLAATIYIVYFKPSILVGIGISLVQKRFDKKNIVKKCNNTCSCNPFDEDCDCKDYEGENYN
jgi:hypothetical protein